jgi:hypothetical protein
MQRRRRDIGQARGRTETPTKLTKTFRAAAAATLLAAFTIGAQAQDCIANFQVEGTPLLTAMNYRSSQTFAGLDSRKALDSLRRAMLAEGFSGIEVDRSGGALTALQESSGSGRPQTLRVTARKSGNGTRVDAVFMIQVGQVAGADTVRSAICRVVSGARS